MAAIIALDTLVPDTVLQQDVVRDVFAAQPGLGRLAQRLVPATFDNAAIETRHSAIAEMSWEAKSEDPLFFDSESGRLLVPSTKQRNDIYAEQAGRLYIEVARKATEGIDRDRITHVITVSCTGFFAPGPEYLIARELKLRPGVQRFHLGFMGCYASMPALKLAKQLVDADPGAVVLVVSVELCTLHVRTSDDPDQIVAASLFSDGAAAAVVASEPVSGGCSLDAFESVVTPVGEADMAWTIGDEGFEMVLSSYVPKIIGEYIEGALQPLFARASASDIQHWAIHPGGRSILDRVQETLHLSEQQLVPSRDTLRDYGNMSSATVLFVLKHILAEAQPGERVCAMAFGPGLTVESGLFSAT
ncbi:type III polyketide synthase [Salinibacterium sp. SYSU T00001]|uniref:type III polyketide synthase n=1 Tax=Homoserinimonas sedimenticola TaxID=2986805 RepID=UPI00223630A7|nr:type III polyketide synthase [Salinibacterium sedimenticola]MCW4385140.1 type III polyketide synthase [Salinibacterium sedimenticola]